MFEEFEFVQNKIDEIENELFALLYKVQKFKNELNTIKNKTIDDGK